MFHESASLLFTPLFSYVVLSLKCFLSFQSTPKGLPRNNSFPNNPASLTNKSGKSRSPVDGSPVLKPGHSGATSRSTQSDGMSRGKLPQRGTTTPPTGKTKRK